MIELSIVVPVYYNEYNLEPLFDDIKAKVFDAADFGCELILVDDGSKDGSWSVIEALCKRDNRVRGYRLSRNFGSHAAILCGLKHASGKCAVVKAADLQEPTELVLQMHASWKQGNNVVLAVRQDRADAKADTAFANLYYRMVQKLALPTMPFGGFDVYLLDRKVIDVVAGMDEKDSALTGQVLWSGFRTAQVPYSRQARAIGKSRWTFKKKVRLVMDTLFSFSTVPITSVIVIGGVSFVGAILWAFVELLLRIFGNITVPGFTMLFIFQLFSFGVTMLTLGILGEYLWRSFDASRKRPVYIIEDETAQTDSQS